MNSVYVLMVVTTIGVTEAPNPFNKIEDCEMVSQRILNSYCVEKSKIDVDAEVKKMSALMNSMIQSMKEINQ